MNIRALLVEPNSEDATFLTDVLAEIETGRHWKPFVAIETVYAPSWPEAAAVLAKEHIDVLLLSASLPDAHGIDLFRCAQAVAPQVPVILLIESAEDSEALRMVREGAQDFLVKREVDCAPLAHAIRNAIERHRLLTSARAGASTDSLTGLPNRSGFTTLADRDRKLAERLGRRMMLLLAQPKNLDEIASAYGEQRRDLALVEAADHLRSMMGPTDLVARLGDGYFGIAILETNAESLESAWARFHQGAESHRIRVGAAIFRPEAPVSFDTLLEQATADLAPVALAARS